MSALTPGTPRGYGGGVCGEIRYDRRRRREALARLRRDRVVYEATTLTPTRRLELAASLIAFAAAIGDGRPPVDRSRSESLALGRHRLARRAPDA